MIKPCILSTLIQSYYIGQSACLACEKPWVQSLAYKNKEINKQNKTK
jgi:hypothetical protein